MVWHRIEENARGSLLRTLGETAIQNNGDTWRTDAMLAGNANGLRKLGRNGYRFQLLWRQQSVDSAESEKLCLI